jgi:hypothetical protein
MEIFLDNRAELGMFFNISCIGLGLDFLKSLLGKLAVTAKDCLLSGQPGSGQANGGAMERSIIIR